MLSRPPDLPDFVAPPVSEVVLGVQFNSLDRLLAPHLGIIWEEFKEQYPETEQHPPLDPVFETFAEKGSRMPVPSAHFELLATIPTPRVFFINSARTELIQVQRDRFHHNWRKVGEGDAYPRFERMLESFEIEYRKLQEVFKRERIGSIEPNQSEVTYINQILLPEGQSPFEAFERLFGSFTKALILDDVGPPEDTRFLLRYIMRDEDGAPIGRLIITAEPAWKLDGSNIVQFALAARGKPHSADLAGVKSFLQSGRRHIVRAFRELTSDEMHKLWERKQ
jgi:uncharacterized protein (TIGR04255 family)